MCLVFALVNEQVVYLKRTMDGPLSTCPSIFTRPQKPDNVGDNDDSDIMLLELSKLIITQIEMSNYDDCIIQK
ncbi:hypothetical protein F2P81_013478 [Scophthalmus maximus]|uniref:Uncharacterized protein n=1 Tax=Scophthalmus maximus TaxID=52904 RepID=A0A6A4STH3_SCOMX|nr:hypothetical protein F2P81_013478 [Scophthalmus maximus]